MDDTTTIRVTSPADLLALVPSVLGFHPEDSLVLVCLGGASLHARVDLPTGAEECAAVAEVLLQAVARNGGDRVLLVAYTDDHGAAQDAVTAVVDAGTGAAEVAGAVRADGSRWFRLAVPSHPVPVGDPGTPYDLSCHPLTARAVLGGRVTLGNRAELARTLRPDPAEVRRVARAIGDCEDRWEETLTGRDWADPAEVLLTRLDAEARWVNARVRRHLDDRQRLSAAHAARLLLAIGLTLRIRDAAWAELTRDNAEAHVELWRDLLRRAPDDLAAPPAALLAFSAWQAGHGALAWCAVDRCREADPSYTLADLVADALEGAVPPRAWTPMTRGSLGIEGLVG